MRRVITLLASSALLIPALLGFTTTAALAAPPPGSYFNGFETNTDGWFPYGGTITRVPSGDASTYASGISAATDDYYARLGLDPAPTTCTYGGGTANIASGPYTNWGGTSSTFPTGGYSTAVDIFLDVPYAIAHPDTRFDWSSVISDTSGNYHRAFVFNVGTDANGFVITGGNNSNRCSANPYSTDPDHAPRVSITTSGWYTFQHTFRDSGAGVLAVDMKVLSGSTVLGTWTRSDPSDIIGSTVGGNNIGWFDQNEFAGLAIDNSTRSGITCLPTGFFRDGINLTAAQIGGDVTGTLDATTCNIGAYNPTSVSGAIIFGANYFGIVANGVTLTVSNTTVRNIGEVPFNGSQHGVAIYYTGSSGTISDNQVSLYQKGGIVVRDGGKVTINGNTVTGAGPVDYIAQNGIQVSFGTSARLFGNNVSLNNYTPPKVTACGLLIYKAGGVSGSSKTGLSYIKADNNFHNNETDICNFGKGGGFSP